MKLSDWIDREGLTQVEFGRRIGKSHATVSRIAAGLQKPDFDAVIAIERETRGEVMARDLIPSKSGSRRAA